MTLAAFLKVSIRKDLTVICCNNEMYKINHTKHRQIRAQKKKTIYWMPPTTATENFRGKLFWHRWHNFYRKGKKWQFHLNWARVNELGWHIQQFLAISAWMCYSRLWKPAFFYWYKTKRICRANEYRSINGRGWTEMVFFLFKKNRMPPHR